MKVQVKTFICCENCGKEFGGPEAGQYSDWDESSHGPLVEYLVSEALSMMWIGLVYGADDVLLCSAKCVNAWIREAAKRDN